MVLLFSFLFYFWHWWDRKWGCFLASLSVVNKIKKMNEGKAGSLLRQWVAGVWGRCVLQLLLLLLRSDATAGSLVGDGRCRCTRRGWPWCCLSKKNAWIENDKRENKKESEYKTSVKCFELQSVYIDLQPLGDHFLLGKKLPFLTNWRVVARGGRYFNKNLLATAIVACSLCGRSWLVCRHRCQLLTC